MEEQKDDFVPRLGMEYPTMEEAWSAWSYYGGKIGFGVRKGRDTRSKIDDVIISKFFVCSCEGKRRVDKRDHLTKNTRAKYGLDNKTPYKSRQVVWTREDQMVSCSCKKFERVGILCWHALKVLDREDIKVIPPRYVLNRWTRAAKNDTVVDIEGRRIIEDPMLEVRNRKADMFHIATPIIEESAHNEEDGHFVRNRLIELQRDYKEYKNKKNGDGNPTTEPSFRLKKKNGGDRRSKRKPSCIEKRKRVKKVKNKTISNSQDLIWPSTNPSQDISEGNFGCFSELEDLYGLRISEP